MLNLRRVRRFTDKAARAPTRYPSLPPRLGGHLVFSAGAAGLPGLDGTAQIALAAAIDLAHSTMLSQVDDHVAFAGMETDPSQETDKPPLAAARVLRIISDLTNVRGVQLKKI